MSDKGYQVKEATDPFRCEQCEELIAEGEEYALVGFCDEYCLDCIEEIMEETP